MPTWLSIDKARINSWTWMCAILHRFDKKCDVGSAFVLLVWQQLKHFGLEILYQYREEKIMIYSNVEFFFFFNNILNLSFMNRGIDVRKGSLIFICLNRLKFRLKKFNVIFEHQIFKNKCLV